MSLAQGWGSLQRDEPRGRSPTPPDLGLKTCSRLFFRCQVQKGQMTALHL